MAQRLVHGVVQYKTCSFAWHAGRLSPICVFDLALSSSSLHLHEISHWLTTDMSLHRRRYVDDTEDYIRFDIDTKRNQFIEVHHLMCLPI